MVIPQKTWLFRSDPRAISAFYQAHKLHRETAENRLKVECCCSGIIDHNVGGKLLISFNPPNPNIVYAGFATGGVFKSTDMGNSWLPIFDSLAVLTVGDIAIDPQNPDVVYVGTGEANGGHNNFPGGGVFKSTNAGLTWQFLGLEETTSIGRVIVHPTNQIYLPCSSWFLLFTK
jgi:hypothetical protein